MEYDGLFEGTKYYGAIGMNILSLPLSDSKIRDKHLAGYHVFSVAPFLATHPHKNFFMSEFYLNTVMLSALTWKRYNGPIHLMTDKIGAEYFRSKSFNEVYDEIIPVLDSEMYGINHQRYWASGKLQALRLITAPFVLIDLDLIVWDVLSVNDCDIAVAHYENFCDEVYPDLSFFDMSPRYKFPSEWSRNSLPLNTSILYFSADDFKEYYASSSIRFMQYERNTLDNNVRCMCFAEQRILGMCAEAKKQRIRTYLNYNNLLQRQNLITHLWSCKNFLTHSPEAAEKYTELCKEKISQLQKEGR